jgi:hypothetical protein
LDVVIVIALFCVLGIAIGYKVGSVLGEKAPDDRRYWLYNAACVGAGVLLAAVVTATGLMSLVGLTVGLIGGSVAGLKFGYGKSVGVWNAHDRALRVNRDQVAAAASARQAREAGLTEEELAARDLMSVDGSAAGAHGARTSGNDDAAPKRARGKKVR